MSDTENTVWTVFSVSILLASFYWTLWLTSETGRFTLRKFFVVFTLTAIVLGLAFAFTEG